VSCSLLLRSHVVGADRALSDADGGDVELEFVLEAEMANQGGAGDGEEEGEEVDEAEQTLQRRILRLISGGEFCYVLNSLTVTCD